MVRKVFKLIVLEILKRIEIEDFRSEIKLVKSI